MQAACCQTSCLLTSSSPPSSACHGLLRNQSSGDPCGVEASPQNFVDMMRSPFTWSQRTHVHMWPSYTMTVPLSTDSVYRNRYVFRNKVLLYYASLLTDRLQLRYFISE
jgi:hypothetical protein